MHEKDRPDFPTTPWSLIREAAITGSEESREALSSLCELYWYPLYVYLRRTGHLADDAQELVQGFFARFLEKNYFKNVNVQDGKFRSYLLAALKHFLSDMRDRQEALKRGGGRAALSLDLEEGERCWANEPRSNLTPERIFERKWALTLLAHVLESVEAEQQRLNKPEVASCLNAFLPGARHSMSYLEAAERTGLTLNAVKVTVHRMRKRYRQILRREVLRTVNSADELEAELRFLLEILGR